MFERVLSLKRSKNIVDISSISEATRISKNSVAFAAFNNVEYAPINLNVRPGDVYRVLTYVKSWTGNPDSCFKFLPNNRFYADSFRTTFMSTTELSGRFNFQVGVKLDFSPDWGKDQFTCDIQWGVQEEPPVFVEMIISEPAKSISFMVWSKTAVCQGFSRWLNPQEWTVLGSVYFSGQKADVEILAVLLKEEA